MLKFGQRMRFSSPSGCNFGIKNLCAPVREDVYDVKVNHRLQFL